MKLLKILRGLHRQGGGEGRHRGEGREIKLCWADAGEAAGGIGEGEYKGGGEGRWVGLGAWKVKKKDCRALTFSAHGVDPSNLQVEKRQYCC